MCLGFAFRAGCTQVALITKSHPEFMAGKLNGLGGEVNIGETPRAAMAREALEEANIVEFNAAWNPFAVLQGSNDAYIVYCFRAVLTKSNIELRGRAEEPVAWHPTSAALAASIAPGDQSLVTHLEWLLPAAVRTCPGNIIHCYA